MEVSSALIYSVRFATKLDLPEDVLSNISKLRLIPVVYRSARPSKVKPIRRDDSKENWRENTLKDVHRRIRETTDPNYDEMLGIFNKVSTSTLKHLSAEAVKILKSRDEQFRLRVVALLFDKAIKGSAYASLMADLAVQLNNEFSEVTDDLGIQIKMFGSLYNMSETLLFPASGDPLFNEKVIAWAKQKDVRRGYSRFLTHIYIRSLIPIEVLHDDMSRIIEDLETSVLQPKTEKLEEIITQYSDFLYEIGKLLPVTAVELRGLLETRVGAILARPRSEVPVLNMRSRFKLEDTQKCVRAA